jgi:uncharacterized membrane protein YkvI
MGKRLRWSVALRLGMTIVGTTIGAGFASGREIWEFFGSYGRQSYGGILLSMAAFWAAVTVLLGISWKKGTRHYSEVLEEVIGPRMARWIDGLVFFFLLSTTVVMLAGSGTIFARWWGTAGFWGGVGIMVVAAFLVLLFDVKGLIALNSWVIPLLIVVLSAVCLQFWLGETAVPGAVVEPEPLPVWPSALVYAAFNVLSLMAVLSPMGKEIGGWGEIVAAGGVGTFSLTVVAWVYNHSLLSISHLVTQYEIPLFALIHNVSFIEVGMVTAILWLAIFTTIIANLYGIVFRLQDVVAWPRWAIGLSALFLLAPLSRIGFSGLIRFLYPLYGVLNLLILANIFLYPFNKSIAIDRKN